MMRRLRRWAKRLGIILLELFVVVTLASVAYNTTTAGRMKPATVLYPGPFVRLDGKLVAYRRLGETRGIVLLDGDALSAGGPGPWVSDVLVGPWFTSAYRIATGSNWIVRRALRDAMGPHHPAFTHAFLDEWKRPFEVRGTLDAFRS